MKNGRFFALTIILLVLLAFACTPSTVPAPVEPTTVQKPLSPSAVSGPEGEWQKLMEAAKKEGSVTLYTDAGGPLRQALTEAVKDKLGLNLECASGSGPELAQKLFAERNAGLYVADVYISGATTPINQLNPRGVLAPLKPLLMLPEVTDLSKWHQGKHWYVDKEEQYIFCMTLYPLLMITINRDMVKPEEIQAYRDVLNPKWKGKIVMGNPTMPSTAQRFFAVMMEYEGYGLDFLRKLAAHEPTLLKDDRLAAEWVARGKNPIGIGLKTDVVADLGKAGAPIMALNIEERSISTSGSGTLAYINKPAHPNAAKAFINWLLTKEGQAVFSEGRLKQSAREDVPTDFLVPADVRKPGLKYWCSDNEEFLLRYPEQLKAAEEIFGPLLK